MKNRMFYKIVKELCQEGRLTESLFYMKSDSGEEFFDLVALYFTDEENYKRAIFMPWPIIKKSRSVSAKIIRETLETILDSHIVSREWHDIRVLDNSPPNDFYPQLPPVPSHLSSFDYD